MAVTILRLPGAGWHKRRPPFIIGAGRPSGEIVINLFEAPELYAAKMRVTYYPALFIKNSSKQSIPTAVPGEGSGLSQRSLLCAAAFGNTAEVDAGSPTMTLANFFFNDPDECMLPKRLDEVSGISFPFDKTQLLTQYLDGFYGWNYGGTTAPNRLTNGSRILENPEYPWSEWTYLYKPWGSASSGEYVLDSKLKAPSVVQETAGEGSKPVNRYFYSYVVWILEPVPFSDLYSVKWMDTAIVKYHEFSPYEIPQNPASNKYTYGIKHRLHARFRTSTRVVYTWQQSDIGFSREWTTT